MAAQNSVDGLGITEPAGAGVVHDAPMDHRQWSRLARRQGGLISRDQLRSLGVERGQVTVLIGNGLLEKLGRGVLRSTASPAVPETRLWRAVLLTRGVLVASSAAYLWGMLDEVPEPVPVAVNRDRRLAPSPGLQVRRLELRPGLVTTRFGLPLTIRSRSGIDCLAGLSYSDATAFADRGIARGWFTVGDLRRRIAQPLGGNAMVRRVLATLVTGAEAESERRLIRLLRANRVSGWTANHELIEGGRLVARIDLAFVAQRLAIEVDGFAYHCDRARFQREASAAERPGQPRLAGAAIHLVRSGGSPGVRAGHDPSTPGKWRPVQRIAAQVSILPVVGTTS